MEKDQLIEKYDINLLGLEFLKYDELIAWIQEIKKDNGYLKIFTAFKTDYLKFELEKEDCKTILNFFKKYVGNKENLWDFTDKFNTFIVSFNEKPEILLETSIYSFMRNMGSHHV